jgi:hypothetical protein
MHWRNLARLRLALRLAMLARSRIPHYEERVQHGRTLPSRMDPDRIQIGFDDLGMLEK